MVLFGVVVVVVLVVVVVVAVVAVAAAAAAAVFVVIIVVVVVVVVIAPVLINFVLSHLALPNLVLLRVQTKGFQNPWQLGLDVLQSFGKQHAESLEEFLKNNNNNNNNKKKKKRKKSCTLAIFGCLLNRTNNENFIFANTKAYFQNGGCNSRRDYVRDSLTFPSPPPSTSLLPSESCAVFM